MRGLHSVQNSCRPGLLGLGVGGWGLLSSARKAVQLRPLRSVSSPPSEQDAPIEGSGGHSPKEMVTVHFRGNEFSVAKGTTLRTALLQNGLSPHNGRAVQINCRGMGACGTCAVKLEGKVAPRTWTTTESRRLNLPPHAPPQNVNLRLACSVQVDGDLKVTKFDKFWGQGQKAVGPASVSDRVTPLGDVEFILDFRRRE